jgi:hypothetical protein
MAEVHQSDPASEPDAEHMLDIIARNPLDLDALRKELAKQSIFADTEQLRQALQWRENVIEFADGAWAHIPSLADDLVLTHRLTEQELELEVLGADGDLDLWERLADDGCPYAEGGEVRARWSPQVGPLPDDAVTGLTGPPGWLTGREPGELVGLRLLGGVLHLETVELGDSETLQQTLHPLLTECASAGQEAWRHYEEEDDPIPGASLDEVVLAVRRSHSESFRRPLLPLQEMIEAAGLEVWRGYVGVPGAPWEGEFSGLDDRGSNAVRAWKTMLAAHRVGDVVPSAAELTALAGALVDENLIEVVGSELVHDPDREPVAEAMADAVASARVAVPLYLRSCAAQGRGDAAAAEVLLESAVESDRQLAPALTELAELRSVRGDAHGARRLYERAGVEPTYPDYAVLRKFLAPAQGEVGRNRACPCGSGKKYKMCHGRELPHAFPLRTDWLWTKLVTFTLRLPQRKVTLDYADILTGEHDDAAWVAVTDGLAHDLALFDGGVLERFLAQRGDLLPDDERALARSWLDSSRRLLEVVEVLPLRGLRCRDLVTGEQLQVLDRTMPAQLEPLDLLFGRPLPDGAGGLRVRDGPRSVPRMMRSRLLALLRDDAAGEEIAAFFAPHSALPQLQTSEGEDLVFCTARYDVDDLDAAWAALSRDLEQTDDDELTETVEVRGRGTVLRGSITRKQGRLVVETNAVERLRRLQERLLSAVPAARLVDESTVPAEKMLAERAESSEAGDVDEPPASGLSPEVEREAIAEMMRRHEESWPDVELPALAGRTPRQAASEPELRPELEALLDDFAWQQRRQDAGLAMDLARLRRTLGLDPR